eukprot:TRINITY_DN698_c0_g2_i1.p1 TRINITY_DN698_c0_g2~~TRINITY_DN698_c0_g2_i1.p1  ORF type:complete len:381 (-),score=77.62 TRINITY_DN698_c0_g2_i1:467-1609(-)
MLLSMSVMILFMGALMGAIETEVVGEWRDGRATFYGHEHWLWSIHEGSCDFGYLCPNEGTGWDVAALPDAHPDFKGACGRCYEVKCHGVFFQDSFENQLDRSNVCHDKDGGSVVVRVVDTCPCNDVKSQYSNQRWCCGDMDHIDLSIWAFEKLAHPKWGVIGLKYRQVPCDVAVDKPALPAVTPFPGLPAPEGETCPKGQWESMSQTNVVQPIVDYSGLVYADGIQGLWQFVNWNAEVFEIPQVGIRAGTAICGRLFPGGAISFAGPQGIFGGQVSLEFWMKGAQEQVIPDIDVNIGGESGQCTDVKVTELSPSGVSTGYTRYNVYMNLFDQKAPLTVVAFASSFRGCAGMDINSIRRISFVNNQAVEQSLCIDQVQLLG